MKNHKTIFIATIIAAIFFALIGVINLACDGDEAVSIVFLAIGGAVLLFSSFFWMYDVISLLSDIKDKLKN